MKQPPIIQAAGHNCTGKASAIQALAGEKQKPWNTDRHGSKQIRSERIE
jgi:hypothetical protein